MTATHCPRLCAVVRRAARMRDRGGDGAAPAPPLCRGLSRIRSGCAENGGFREPERHGRDGPRAPEAQNSVVRRPPSPDDQQALQRHRPGGLAQAPGRASADRHRKPGRIALPEGHKAGKAQGRKSRRSEKQKARRCRRALHVLRREASEEAYQVRWIRALPVQASEPPTSVYSASIPAEKPVTGAHTRFSETFVVSAAAPSSLNE